MSKLSPARMEIKEYVVRPTGYDECPYVDKATSFCLYLYDGGMWGWSVRDFPGGQGRAMNRKGEFIMERRGHGQNKTRRYDLATATSLALKWVDDRKLYGGKTVAELIASKVVA